MIRALVVLIATAASLAACASAEKQWTKPGADYTVADFQRDRAACEKAGKVDDECLKQRGWIPLSPDKAAPPPEIPTHRGRYY